MINDLIVRMVPSAISPNDLENRCVVMADILRASSTMIHALVNGALAVYPQAEIGDSRQLAKQLVKRLGESTSLGGERNGKIVDGFDCGNSPIEYSAERIGGKNLVLCTTNGTFTLKLCQDAERILIGAFVNLSAVCQQMVQHPAAMIACAGTNRMVTDEDVLFAGAVTEKVLELNPDVALDDSAKICLSRWKVVNRQLTAERELWHQFAESHGGRNLVRIGYEADVQFCAQIDAFDLVPELDLDTWCIHPVEVESGSKLSS